jgi:serine/threonine protein kinase
MDGRLLGGRYRLLEAHAMGGMASVWRANDERTGEVVAIKRLHPHLVEDEGARERFRREAAAMEAIRHPNVVAVRDAVLDEAEPALVMDFVAGRSVAELAADGHRFDEPEALAIGAAVADGLGAVHERGIVHRDLKPANVLIGDDGVARLSDFGIAVGLMDATALTADDGVVGTLRYLAPERLAGTTATPATDVWGLGTVLYEMLTGVAAFPATTLAARVEAASTPVTRPDGLADATWAILARALASDPADRYPDGAAMAADLHRLPGVPAPVVVPPDPSDPTEVIAIPAAATVAAAAVPHADEPSPVIEPSPPSAPDSPILDRRPSRSALAMGGIVGALALALVVGMAAGSSPGDPAAAAGAESPGPAATTKPTVEPTPAAQEVDKDDNDTGKGKGNGKGKGGD